MPQWIHERADHIRRKNPGMPKSESFAIATQQSHATGHTPKGYGTPTGKHVAKQKYDEPKSDYTQTADPRSKSKTGGINLGMMRSFADELEKIAFGQGMNTAMHGAYKNTAPKMTTKPTAVPREPAPPAPTSDLLRSSKTVQPPPVTAGSL
jgi:hypothetical protein